MHVQSPFKATKPTPLPVRPPKQVASADSSLPPQASPPPPRGVAHREFTVQVAAYNAKAQADALVTKLTADGYTVRVWGTQAPFRVRIGRYPTWSDANAAHKELAAKQIESFVTEAEP
jgi:cell division protein FtsN